MSRTPDHPVHPQFPGRWSPRAFSNAPLSAADLLPLFEAARWAPSASNNQPWRMAYGLRGDAAFAAIHGGLLGFNQAWADKAGALIVLASKDVTSDGRPNNFAAFDAGTAWGHLALQAHLSGMITHAMGGFDAAILAPALHLPADHTIRAVIAVGHQGDAAALPEALQPRETPSPRISVDSFASQGGFV